MALSSDARLRVEPEGLTPLVPKGTEFDSSGRTKHFASMVGFLFLDTRVPGLAIPFHRDFEEINLRFYVRHKAEEGWRRGVVLVKKNVPRIAIALTARWLYNENYIAAPTGNVILHSQANGREHCDGQVSLEVPVNGFSSIELATRGEPSPLPRDSRKSSSCSILGLLAPTRRRHGGISRRAVLPWRIWQTTSPAA